MISFFCPYSKHVHKVASDHVGILIACEQCKLDIRVPAPAAPPSLVVTPPQAPKSASSSWWTRFLRRGEMTSSAKR